MVPVKPQHGKDALGAYGENLAVRHLESIGLEVLDRNWRCAIGELDIVARDNCTLVVCEVKTRSGTGFGSPLEAVTPAKAQRLRRLALAWLADRRTFFDALRFDVIGVMCSPGDEPSLQHVRGIV